MYLNTALACAQSEPDKQAGKMAKKDGGGKKEEVDALGR